MKQKYLAALLTVTLLVSLSACGGSQSAAPVVPPVEVEEPVPTEAELAMEAFWFQYEGSEETDAETALLDSDVSLTDNSAAALLETLGAFEVTYPYADITNLQDSYERYLAMELPWTDDTDYGSLFRLPLQDGELLEIVKVNNEMFLSVHTIENATYSLLEDDYLEWVCQVLTDTINRETAEWDFGTQLDSIDWTIANLKVLAGATFNLASVTKGAIMQVNKAATSSMDTITDNELGPAMTITHEGEHLLQSMSTPGLEALGLEQGYGFCYSWADLPVNALYTSWFIEASAEKLAAYFYDTEPNTYLTMISYLDSLTVLAALTGADPIEVPRLSQQGTLESVLNLFGRESEAEQLEFLNLLYAIQVIQQSPDDFWAAYTAQTGLDKENEENLIEVQRHLKAAACLTMSRMFYENLTRLLTENTLTVRELFYLIYSWEFDINYHLGYEDEARLHNTGVFLEGYSTMQQVFFATLAEAVNIPVEDLTELYNAAHARARVPKTSMLHGDEVWDAEDIAPLSRAANDFWDKYYQTVSQKKAVPVSIAADILQNK